MPRGRRKGGNKEKVFGCDLLEHLNASSQEIPLVLRCCSEFVEHHGIVDGIYRLSGVSSNIQKLRSEFESDGPPDLNKDVYLQDIHCVSSLCKAYFRELPNPLLTYQLYDKFAEAVAIQLEEERLVKIKNVLKELPPPHYRTLEFLMFHLVRMASYSTETNMHARNLAIVWAPNLLRSKDIEATGFNGTAAFMEVRVQSIVVEFILTHVSQLFPEEGVSRERRKSLPSPFAVSNQEEGFLKSVSIGPVTNFGNISPGDGPLAMRPYHAIIEGTDKRKGSLKGRKWMSIFNIGGRFPDPRRRHKNSAKEKDRSSLRPARSMDSLSTQSYPKEGSRQPVQHHPSPPTVSPLVSASPQAAPDVTATSGRMGGSEYAVTYRRGTGLVIGGTQGTYTALDPNGSGTTGSDVLQSRSPGLSTKAGRRAAMHITGPTLVTVPLHITSNLALGVLQGGGSDRVIHRGRCKDGGDKVEGKDVAGKVEWRTGREKVEKEDGKEREVEKDMDGGVHVEEHEVVKPEERREEEEVQREDAGHNLEQMEEVGAGAKEQRAKSCSSNTEEEDAARDKEENEYNTDYMDMKGNVTADPGPAVTTQPGEVDMFDGTDVHNSTAVDGDNQELFGYVQDNFEFLDHMDCSSSYQVNEFSVEPPGHSDDEYEVMVQAEVLHHPVDPQKNMQPGAESLEQSQSQLKPHRPLSLDVNSRHTKSLSLPYMTSPVRGPEESSTEEEEEGEEDSDDYSSEDEESMFMKSLPPDFFFNSLGRFGHEDVDRMDGVTVEELRLREQTESESLHSNEQTGGDQGQREVMEEEEDDEGRVETETTENKEEGKDHNEPKEELEEEELEEEQEEEGQEEEGQEEEGLEEQAISIIKEEEVGDMDNNQVLEEKSAGDASFCCMDFPEPYSDEFNIIRNEEEKVKEEEEVKPDSPLPDYLPCHTEEESRGQDCDAEETKGKQTDNEDTPETAEGDTGGMFEERTQEGDSEEESDVCSSSIWEQLEDVVCEVIEDEEDEMVQRGSEGNAEERDEKEVEDLEGITRQEGVEGGGGRGATETEVREDVETEPMDTTGDTNAGSEGQKKKVGLPEIQLEKKTVNEETTRHDREDAAENKSNAYGGADELLNKPQVEYKQVKELEFDGLKPQSVDRDTLSGRGVGRMLVISKNPKIYQVKAVPVVPPKPKHCKFTALTIWQQQQPQPQQQQQQQQPQPQHKDGACRQTLLEQDKVWCAEEQEKDGGERDWRRRSERREEVARKNSPLSMCFDEAVAIATMRREKERESFSS